MMSSPRSIKDDSCPFMLSRSLCGTCKSTAGLKNKQSSCLFFRLKILGITGSKHKLQCIWMASWKGREQGKREGWSRQLPGAVGRMQPRGAHLVGSFSTWKMGEHFPQSWWVLSSVDSLKWVVRTSEKIVHAFQITKYDIFFLEKWGGGLKYPKLKIRY